MQTPSLIPFNVPYLAGPELEHVTQASKTGHLSGDGVYTKIATEELKRLTGARGVLLTTSCTHALEMAALLLSLAPGDEVIMPSFTFVSTANAFVLRGAVPVFVDSRPDTLNVDERQIEAALSPRTKAIVVMHYGGVACEMSAITAIAERHGLSVIEDNAHGLGATYRGQPLGTFGEMATQSFHETKNIHCGEGGALLINNDELWERAEILREKGTNRSQFFRGAIDKYTWVDLGSSYLPSDLLAAFLLGQLEQFESIQAQRHRIWTRYDTDLAKWAQRHGVDRPSIPSEAAHPAHLYYLLLPDVDRRQAFIAHMREYGVMAVFHYVPLHSSPAGRRFGRAASSCHVAEQSSQRLVRLPLYAGLTESDCERVIDAATSFRV